MLFYVCLLHSPFTQFLFQQWLPNISAPDRANNNSEYYSASG